MAPRRLVFAALCLAIIACLGALLWRALAPGGITGWEWVILFAYAGTMPWSAISAANALLGYAILIGARDPPAAVVPQLDRAREAAVPSIRTAILVCIRREDMAAVIPPLHRLLRGLKAAGVADRFTLWLLSDTPEPAPAEEAAAAALPAQYRRRAENTGFKSGNVMDWCDTHGAGFEAFLCLDADSEMSAAAVLRLVSCMEADPRLAIIQQLIVGRPVAAPFPRLFQFGMRAGMRAWATGQGWWQGDEGPYWGHNALIRVAPFRAHARLERLPDGSQILSHDQVEAVRLHAAGWKIRCLPEEDGSQEGNPPAMPEFLRHNPADPHWADRDRFVLSNGHASMLLYALLHLTGYDLPMSELRNFRQLHSKTPGHPEVDVTPGVETTTGPLGQGLANAVGMALAEKLLAAEFNRPDHTIVDHRTWVFVGDGCLMEGISHEAIALAGAWKLNKLVALYDDNGISIDGKVAPWYIDNVSLRFAGCGWTVLGPVDGQDAEAVAQAIAASRAEGTQPTLIICRTTIGKGSPNRAGTAKAHGEALGAEEIKLTREALGWTSGPFVIPEEAYAAWDARPAGRAAQEAWSEAFAAYAAAFPDAAAEFERRMAGALPAGFTQTAVDTVIAAHAKAESVASRKSSQIALEAFTKALPEMLGGSADLTGSNLTNTTSTLPLRMGPDGQPVLGEDGRPGRHINYGVREFGMAAVMNGIALHGGYIPYGGTFLTFSDYSRNAIRMAALMKRRVIHVFTHDSIGLGEDGPTHQSVEHAASLRLIPNLDVWRPADTAETVVAWTMALGNASRPSALLLSRQTLPYLPKAGLDDIGKGAYVLAEPSEVGLRRRAQAVIIATGSEVGLAMQAQDALARLKIAVRVVSMPSTTTFDRQSVAYKKGVLPAGIPRIAVEAGVTDGWWKYGCAAVIGIDTFGESAPAPELFKHFHLTVQNVVDTVRKVLRG